MKPAALTKWSLGLLAAGILFGAGVRISQWLIPEPETQLVLCTTDDADNCVELEAVDGSDADSALDPDSVPAPPAGMRRASAETI